ncbi:MAG TPA: hypothetical protein DCZ69_11895 [Syntrophobacteraceae bacterium]|nr:hypothetical protein [Syntrophobacteraceae bacterium]
MHTKRGSFCAGAGGNGKNAFHCFFCGLAITSSDRFTTISHSNIHCFTNPSGLRCEIYTFSSCPGAIPYGQPTDEHSWFPEFRWSLALCRQCKNHLGWHYTSISKLSKPRGFWGLLSYHLRTR